MSNVHGWKFLVLLCAANVVAYMGVFELPPIIGNLVHDFHISYTEAGLFMSVYAFVRMLASLLTGTVSDRYGAKRLVLGGLLLVAAAGFLCAHSRGFASMLVYRTVIGIGATLVFIPGLATSMYLLRPDQVNLVTGTFFTSMNFGLALALLITPIMAASFSWRTPLNVFSGITIVIAAVFFFSTFGKRFQTLAISGEQTRTIGYAAGEYSIRNKPLLLICGAYFLMLFHTYGIITWLPEYLRVARRYSPTEVGSVSMWLGLVMVPGTFVAGWLGDRLGAWWIGLAGAALCGVCPALMVILHGLNIAGVLTDIIVLAFGICLLVVPLTSILSYLVPAKDNGKAVGLVHTAGYAGSLIATYLGGYLLTRTGNYTWTFMLYVAGMAVTLILLLMLYRCYTEARNAQMKQFTPFVAFSDATGS